MQWLVWMDKWQTHKWQSNKGWGMRWEHSLMLTTGSSENSLEKVITPQFIRLNTWQPSHSLRAKPQVFLAKPRAKSMWWKSLKSTITLHHPWGMRCHSQTCPRISLRVPTIPSFWLSGTKLSYLLTSCFLWTISAEEICSKIYEKTEGLLSRKQGTMERK